MNAPLLDSNHLTLDGDYLGGMKGSIQRIYMIQVYF